MISFLKKSMLHKLTESGNVTLFYHAFSSFVITSPHPVTPPPLHADPSTIPPSTTTALAGVSEEIL
jgi:hypothetical protein